MGKGNGNAKAPLKQKRGEDVDPLFVDPTDDAYAPYFQDFNSKRAPDFTAVKDITLCEAYAAVSKEPTVGMDQTTETFWSKIFESFVVLSGSEAANGQFFKRSPKSMKDRCMQTIQPSINIFNRYFKNITVCEFEEAEGKPFRFLQCAKLLHKMP